MDSSLLESGVSSISASSAIRGPINNEGDKGPSLVLLSKSQELVKNYPKRTRFPDPTSDRSLLIECCFPEEGALSKKVTFPVAHWARPGSVNCNRNIFRRRYALPTLSLSIDDESVVDPVADYLISIDSIEREITEGESKHMAGDLSRYIMISEIQDHMIASSILPDGVSGYWIRLFGQKTVFSLVISLWKRGKSVRCCKSHGGKAHNNQVATKVDEIIVILKNTGPLDRICRKNKHRRKKTAFYNNWFSQEKLQGTFHFPSFCSKETFIQISMCLGQCRENGQYDLFEEMYTKFNLRTESTNEEQKLFLWIERSLCLAVQGKFPEAKKLLQEVVENVPRGSNKTYLLNRAYIYLAHTHVIEGNFGTADDCLTMLQIDRKNGTPYEDLGIYHMLRGMILMAFGTKVPKFSSQLFKESFHAFQEAFINFHMCLPLLFNHLCYSHIKSAQLLMCQGKSCEKDRKEKYDTVQEKLKTIDNIGIDKLADRIKCSLNIVKADHLCMTGNLAEGNKLLSEARYRANVMNFAEEIRQCEEIETGLAGAEYIRFFDSIQFMDEKLDFQIDARDCKRYFYDADQSSC